MLCRTVPKLIAAAVVVSRRRRMTGLPKGTVTFLFTDIEGSTTLLQELGDAVYAEVVADHHNLLRTIIDKNGGHVIDAQGDACLAAFSRASEAVAAAVAAQRTLVEHAWPSRSKLMLRMGLHTGEPVGLADNYVGLDVNRTARICAAGHGGQILVSGTTAMLVSGSVPQGAVLRDLGPHRLKDLHQLERIFQVIHPELPSILRPLNSLTTLANNLPSPLTSFVGREREIVEVKRLLSVTRLLTLTGIGGCGKTRLAIQVASESLETYPDGVWLVELATLTDPALIPRAAASAVGVGEEPARALMSTLLAALRDKQLLIVLDNCEHVVAGCAQFAEAVLRMCPAVRVLATSRESLGITTEAVWQIPPLTLPDPQSHLAVDSLLQCEAIRLFVERATSVLPRFKLTSDNADMVTLICRHLDGIPLAVELAAAQTQALSLTEIASRLTDRFRLLTRGSRTKAARQQTLQATMDWSFQLLPESERAIFRRLSVFAGGWTLEAAETVCADDGTERSDVLDCLVQLVCKSLIVVEHHRDEARYHLLETVRQYGADRLMESGEDARLRTRHLLWCLQLAERANPELLGITQATWFDRLELEHDNLRAALAWSLQSDQAESGLRLAGSVWRFWWIRGYFGEGRAWLETLLRHTGGVATIDRAKGLQAAGILAVLGQGDYASGGTFLTESLAIWRQVGDTPNIAALLDNLGTLFSVQDQPRSARTLYGESLDIRRQLGDTWGIALSLNNVGFVLYRQRDYAAAYAHFEESLALWRERGDPQNIGKTLSNLGLVSLTLGSFAKAYAFLKESLEVRREVGDKWGIAHSLEGFAGLAEASGNPARAARLFGAAEALRDSIGAPVRPTDRPDYDQRVAAARAQLTSEAFTAAWVAGRAMTLSQAVEDALDTLETGPGGGYHGANGSGRQVG
jgi:predicted ATPase/class 3 adenylate cyclase